MAIGNGSLRRKGAASSRRMVVLVVPPVEELDLVGPIQVFSAANRLAGKPFYNVEIATNGKDLKVEGEHPNIGHDTTSPPPVTFKPSM